MISNKPHSICRHFSCDNLTRTTYCKDHKHIQQERNTERHKQYNKQRDPILVKFYNSKEWIALRDYVMMTNNYLCIGCSVHGIKPVFANVVHHIRYLKHHPELALDINNLIPLCHDCHNKTHAND